MTSDDRANLEPRLAMNRMETKLRAVRRHVGRCRRFFDELIDALALMRRFMPFLKEHRRRIVIATCITIFLSSVEQCVPLVLKVVVDRVVPEQNWPLFFVIMGAFLGLTGISQVIEAAYSYILFCMNAVVSSRLSVRYLGCLFRLPMREIQRRQLGEHLYRATADVQAVCGTLMSLVTGLSGNIIGLPLSIGIMLWLSGRITVVYLVFIPCMFAVRVWASMKLRVHQEEVRRQEEAVSGLLGQVLGATKVVKLARSETTESLRYLRLLRTGIRVRFGLWLKQLWVGKVQWLTESGTGIALQWWIWVLVMRHSTSLGAAMAISWYLSRIVGPFMALAGTAQMVIANSVPGKRVMEVLTIPKEKCLQGSRMGTHRTDQDIVLEEVSFRYGDDREAVDHVSCRFRSGEITALIGKSGSGKTTIANLICGFYPEYGGYIGVGGMDLRTLALCSLRANIAMVPQDPFLFVDTVRENIGYGNRGVREEGFVEAAKMAYIHERILELPQQYDTELGLGAGALSVGERQRIVVARAFAGDAPILILDEICSNLDVVAEDWIMSSLLSIRERKTILMISHRLSSILMADRVVVLDQGRVVESGTPQQLMEHDGYLADWVRKGQVAGPMSAAARSSASDS